MDTKAWTSHSDLVRQSLTSDRLGRYYTSSNISRTLVNAIVGISPKVVVELGAGNGAIVNAASEKWGKAKFITVDADTTVVPQLIRLGHSHSHKHHVQDALDDALAERIGLRLGSVDVGLCNPPYVRPKWRSSFGRILEDAGLSGALKSVHDAGADLLFIAQNLRLLKSQGKLGLVLPDGLITGEKFQGVRSVLLREHLVEQVIQLPRRVFSKTEAQTYLMILAKRGGETQSVELRSMDVNGLLSSAIHVAADIAARRLDYSYHSVSQTHNTLYSTRCLKLTLGEVTEDLIRGTLNSNQLESLGFPVFHLSDFPLLESDSKAPPVPTRFIRSQREYDALPAHIRVAKRGDILIARVGRNLHRKICVLRKGTCVISDCVYALRVAPDYRDAVLAYLTSSSGRQAIESVSHGVGARYLSRSDLLELVMLT